MEPNPNPASTAAPQHTGSGAQPNPDGTVTVQDTPKPGPPAAAGSDGKAFSAEDIARARQEEKDKLYGRLNKDTERLTSLEAELAALRAEREQREKDEAERLAAEEAAAKQKAEADMSAKKLLEERSTEWERRFEEIQKEREQERAALAKEAEYNALRAYVQERVGAERNNIAPELVDLVQGNSQEEIDASIELLKAKTNQLVESMQQAQQTARSQMRGVSATGYTGNGPTDQDAGNRQLSADDIKNMPMSEFAKYRSQLLGAASNQNSNRGLFD